MIFTPTPIPGALLVDPNRFDDPRGRFIKVYHQREFAANGLDFNPVEEFYTVSHENVIRGMHLQSPPAAHDKLVYCLQGRMLDVILDLRKNSPAYGRFYSVEIDAVSHRSLFVPAGVAHGFLSLNGGTMVMYSVNTMHEPASDGGVRWDSFGMDWPCKDPIISARDKSLPAFSEFDSPFVYKS